MNSTRPQVLPTTPVNQCLHPDCHAHHAHPLNRPQPQVISHPDVSFVVTRRQFKVNKNWVIGILIVLFIGLIGSLNDSNRAAADLKAKAEVGQSSQSTRMANLDYAIKLCGKIAAKDEAATCIAQIMAAGH
jgi:hypothetical protein